MYIPQPAKTKSQLFCESFENIIANANKYFTEIRKQKAEKSKQFFCVNMYLDMKNME